MRLKITVSFQPSELIALDEAAKRAGLTRSGFLRALFVEFRRTVHSSAMQDDLAGRENGWKDRINNDNA